MITTAPLFIPLCRSHVNKMSYIDPLKKEKSAYKNAKKFRLGLTVLDFLFIFVG